MALTYIDTTTGAYWIRLNESNYMIALVLILTFLAGLLVSGLLLAGVLCAVKRADCTMPTPSPPHDLVLLALNAGGNPLIPGKPLWRWRSVQPEPSRPFSPAPYRLSHAKRLCLQEH